MGFLPTIIILNLVLRSSAGLGGGQNSPSAAIVTWLGKIQYGLVCTVMFFYSRFGASTANQALDVGSPNRIWYRRCHVIPSLGGQRYRLSSSRELD